jgi:hypothetical protein
MSKEHVMRSALRKYHLPLRQEYTSSQKFKPVGSDEIVSRTRIVPQSAFDWLVNDVCKVCNEGWLNLDVEGQAEEFLAAAMQGLFININADNSRKMALWAAKTAAVRALMDPLPRAIPPEHYAYIKQNLEPPPNTFVWLAHIQYASDPSMRHTRLGTTADPGVAETKSHFTSIIYGHMALYIIGASNEEGLWIYEETISAIEQRDTLQLWPVRHSANWPGSQIPLDIVRELTTFIPPSDQREVCEILIDVTK